MTPTERARQIDQYEFRAESKAAVERALAYAKQCRKLEGQKVRAWIGEEAQPLKVSFVFSGRPPATHSYNGVSRTLAQWAAHLGITVHTLVNRRRRLGSLEAAIAMGGATTGGREPTIVTFNGQSRPLQQWAAINGLKLDTIHHRLRAGWSIADAITTPTGGKPGVVSNFSNDLGTGGGSDAQDSAHIDFSSEG